MPRATAVELLWSGAPAADEGIPIGELPAWLEAGKGATVACLGAPVHGVQSDPDLEADVRHALNRVRRVKDEVELERMRAAERATRAGFARAVELIAPGRTERDLQIEIEAEFFRTGGDAVAYETIVAGGPNSAVLHFLPTARPFETGDLVLIDAGADVRGYASDVTRTYPASGAFTPEQEALHGVVAEGLADFGLLRGEAATLVESGAASLFFPHGIGHMVGLGIRDAGEVLRGRAGTGPGLPVIRVDLPLEPGNCFTVEPGVYFVPALLRDEERRRQHRDTVDWDRVDDVLGCIRIEHNVLVTQDGREVLTADVPLLG